MSKVLNLSILCCHYVSITITNSRIRIFFRNCQPWEVPCDPCPLPILHVSLWSKFSPCTLPHQTTHPHRRLQTPNRSDSNVNLTLHKSRVKESTKTHPLSYLAHPFIYPKPRRWTQASSTIPSKHKEREERERECVCLCVLERETKECVRL